MRKFFVSENDIKNNEVSLKGSDFHHLVRVLRVNPGDEILLLDGKGRSATGTVKEILDDKVKIALGEWEAFDKENTNFSVTLYQSVPKGSKLKTIVEKGTELGTGAFIPFYSQRSIPKPTKSDEKKRTQLERVAEAASKQCGRSVIPPVSPYLSFNNMVEDLSKYDLVLLAYENEEKTSLKSVLESEDFKTPVNIALIIGPEGGFTEDEVEILTAANARAFSLGKRILRTETAGIAAIAQINYAFEDL